MQINHGLCGERHIVTERPDKSVLVSTGLNRRFFPAACRGAEPYVCPADLHRQQRDLYTRLSPIQLQWRGYYHYVPVYTIVRCFMGGSPTRGPRQSIIDGVGPDDLWYGYYGSYFVPYPAYPTASLWLTGLLTG